MEKTAINIKPIFSHICALGESPLWHPKENVLYWVDMVNMELHRLNPENNQHQFWKMPTYIGSIALRKSGGLIAAIGDDICFIDLPSGKISVQQKVPGGLRLNDGKCDRQGRFWVGTIDTKNGNASLYRYDPDGSLHTMENGIYISNGLGWNKNNTILYYNDSFGRKTYVYDFDNKTGAIKHRKIFADFAGQITEPDGLTVDSEDCIWMALWNSAKVLRYHPNGKIEREISMPVLRPTSCMFGGKNLDQLFITSCSRDTSETATLSPPAGQLFCLDLGIKGMPEPEFAG